MKISLVLGVSFLAFVSCNSSSKNTEAAKKKDTAVSANGLPTTKEIIDPVCGMVKDSTWTDYTVYKSDTVWFCAESEKKAFEGNPKKYEAGLNNK